MFVYPSIHFILSLYLFYSLVGNGCYCFFLEFSPNVQTPSNIIMKAIRSETTYKATQAPHYAIP
jgi:hypothetical protein